MASVHIREKSKYFHASYLGPDGRWILRSTKCTERTAALAVALEFERASRLARRGELVEATAREVLNDIMKRAGTADIIRAPSTRDFLTGWLEGKTKRKAEGTGKRYLVVITKFIESLGNRADRPLTALTASDVERYINARLTEKIAPQTVAFDVKVLRTALNAARRQGLISINCAQVVELPEGEAIERSIFTPAEVKMLIDAAKSEEWKSLIMLGYFTGARLSDCCRITWQDVALREETLTFTQQKTGRKVTVPLHPALLAHLEKLAGSDSPNVFVLPGMATLKPGGRHGLSEGFKRIMHNAGLSTQSVNAGGQRNVARLSFHSLRHSFASALANAGIPAEVRMKLTGHTDAAIHAGYSHLEMKTLRDAIERLTGLE